MSEFYVVLKVDTCDGEGGKEKSKKGLPDTQRMRDWQLEVLLSMQISRKEAFK